MLVKRLDTGFWHWMWQENRPWCILGLIIASILLLLISSCLCIAGCGVPSDAGESEQASTQDSNVVLARSATRTNARSKTRKMAPQQNGTVSSVPSTTSAASSSRVTDREEPADPAPAYELYDRQPAVIRGGNVKRSDVADMV